FTEPCRYAAKIRYGKNESMASLSLREDGRLQVDFDEPQRAVTPGQSVVFYEGDTVVGGGVIEEACRTIG
ncbi:aminomethyltransferase beta-barrel domain-containing protein, partial [Selenomonas sp.]|nr:tRNA 2-thiouridine(34) synthase MnmA [Selenomonas sp.]